MDIIDLVQNLRELNWLDLIFKIIALIFALGYLGYSIIFHQQLVKMKNNALVYYHLLNYPNSTDKPTPPMILSFSVLQLFIAVFLIIISLLLI